MTKIIIAVGIFLIAVLAAAISGAYEHGWKDGYMNGIIAEQERSKSDGNSERNGTELH